MVGDPHKKKYQMSRRRDTSVAEDGRTEVSLLARDIKPAPEEGNDSGGGRRDVCWRAYDLLGGLAGGVVDGPAGYGDTGEEVEPSGKGDPVGTLGGLRGREGEGSADGLAH